MHTIAAVWGYLLYKTPSRARTTTLTNLRTCFPAMTEAELASLTLKSLQNTACTALEMGKSWLPPIEKTLALVNEYEGLEQLRAALESEQGVILVVPHFGNWEVCGYFVGEHGESTFMYQPPKLAPLDKLLRRARARSGIKLAPTNRRGVAQLLKALQQGELVGVLPDQVPADESGILAPFFGEPAYTMTLVSKLLQRTDARAFYAFAERLPGAKGFKIVIREAREGIYSEDLQESVAALNKTVEDCANAAVAQYQWEYKRFRRRPGLENIYSDRKS